ncbi:MAG: hypothetical protein HPY61_11590 [Methanotrichaceae archaeon]|nr:hypothetical protein [Methanotrichaceae archaeon]
MSIKFLLTALLIGLLLIVTTSAQTNSNWEKSNGGWIVVKNSHVYNTGEPFHPCPEQTGCNRYPIHVEHGICINAVTFDDATVGASWTPPDYNIILAKDCGTNEWMRVDCPVVTKFWVPAGTYTLTEFTYVSEVNPGDPSYSPCSNAWSKTPKTVVIKPGDTVDFGESVFMNGPCTEGGYPCTGGPLGSSSGGCHSGWTGKWEVTWGEMDFERTEMTLQQTGTTITGTYPFDQGRIQGTISGNKLIGQWSESPSYSPPDDAGDFEFTMSDDCKSISGKYRYGSSGSWRDWNGKLLTIAGTDLNGNWEMGGPYNAGEPCQIIQQGSALAFINENGDQSEGGFIDESTVIATDWEDGLRGTISDDGNRIDWANGTWWVRNSHEEGFDEIEGQEEQLLESLGLI